MRHLMKSCLSFVCMAGICVAASAVPVEIDRTRRTIDVPAVCLQNAQPINDPFRGGVMDTRFTFVLSTTERLKQRIAGAAAGDELSWFHFKIADDNHDMGLNEAQRFRRALVLARCGLPWTAGDENLYQLPADAAAMIAFLTYAMDPGRIGARDPRARTGYTLVSNGEREGILMYAALRIKMDLTPTMVGQNRVCQTYYNFEGNFGCMAFTAEPLQPLDPLLGLLYEGINRVTFTGHEFWLMFSNPAYRNKVYFTHGTAAGNVDNFLTVNTMTGASVEWSAPGGNREAFPDAPFRPYRFENWINPATNNRDFHQTVMQDFQRRHRQRILTYKQW
ncbi:hypothetical protein SAMN05518865_12431 [Duganella sp. CF458]|uniref:hypothetical protein n=1 Tax=Duganella sp. CF458 TaxID=1884368 RepID=UPI0008E6A740|nr:hypothetical protein [Duganella sp. CF458]SFG94440.1 hypothetical protein SAMN05518865_12431 [Duganella sp. CF458]